MPFCSKCGANVADGAAYCNACGQAQPGSASQAGIPTAPISAPPPFQSPNYPTNATIPLAVARPVAYAGFWFRFVAWIIDAIVLGIAGAFIILPFGGLGTLHLHRLLSGHPLSPDEVFGGMGLRFHAFIVTQILHWIYYALLESSAWQATLGKKALGLEVTDLTGMRVSFGRASGRFLGRYLSAMTLGIGYIMAGITMKKQALHDILAGTLVVRKV